VLIKRIGGDRDLNPLSAAGDDREGRHPGIGHPHVVLELGHVLFGRGLLRERPRQHELGLVDRPGPRHHAVEGGRHKPDDRVLDPALDVRDGVAGIAFVPLAIEVLGHEAELDDEVGGEVLRPDLAPFLLPEADQGLFVLTLRRRKFNNMTLMQLFQLVIEKLGGACPINVQ
jgi:hypothetical protein